MQYQALYYTILLDNSIHFIRKCARIHIFSKLAPINVIKCHYYSSFEEKKEAGIDPLPLVIK